MFKNILVASDGSKCGSKAVDLAIDMAVKYGAKISALYVMDFDSDFSYDELEKGVVVVEHIITANPVFDMETMIRKINPEIAVFGARGLGADKEGDESPSRIGSVALNALKVSKVPVILVK